VVRRSGATQSVSVSPAAAAAAISPGDHLEVRRRQLVAAGSDGGSSGCDAGGRRGCRRLDDQSASECVAAVADDAQTYGAAAGVQSVLNVGSRQQETLPRRQATART